jgi:uncharacterized repeat protein (TIGR01451 family)
MKRLLSCRMGWLIFACLTLGLLFLLPWHSQAQMNESSFPTETIVTLQKSDNAGLTFQLALPQAIVADETISVTGLTATLHEPGAPALPYYTTWLAVPPGAEVQVTVNETAVTTSYAGHIRAAPQHGSQPIANLPAWERNAYAQLGIEAVPLLVEAPDPEIYGRSQPYPGQTYQLTGPMYYRDLQVVALHLYPLRYNPVTQALTQSRQIEVQVSFSQADLSRLRLAADSHDQHEKLLSGMLLNYEDSRGWRIFPAGLEAFAPALPEGVQAYKIKIDQDGIYEITGQELANVGMDLSSVEPGTIEMMHRGQPVAYQFISSDPNTLEPSDRIRFYGQAFAGPRLEQQFVKHNVYWLWAGGEATPVAVVDNEAGEDYPLVYSFPEEITRAPENVFWGTWTDKWDDFPNEPDAWYWEHVSQGAQILTKTYAITLPYPVTDAAGPEATVLVELMSREQSTAPPTSFNYDVRVSLNNYPGYGQHTWERHRNVNITGTVAANYLTEGLNDVVVVYATDWTVHPHNPRYYFNRITVNYERQLTAVADQLQFTGGASGPQEFQVSNFSQAASDQVVVWNVTEPNLPSQIQLTNDDIIGSNPYTYKIGHDGPGNRRFIATTTGNLLSVAGLSAYTVEPITPAAGADWIAITYADFRPAAEQLAAHRADEQFGGLATHVVDIEDVINQYGHGLPLPEAIQNYLTSGLLNWEIAPSYVLLVGQGHQNPRNLANPSASNPWDKNLPNYVLTDLVFKDRFQGLIPSDHTFAALIGDDLLPDLAVGRIATASLTDTYNLVNKIIQYDLNQLAPQPWHQHYLFVADTADQGGNFCALNETTGSYLPGSLAQTHLCRPTNSPGDTEQIRADMSGAIHDPDLGVTLLNYRGHGAVDRWAQPPILDTSMTDFWQNDDKPLIILSADCLDGNFGWPGWTALSQTFLHLPDVGTAAHWSSTGLGYTDEHSVLLRGLYEGAFDQGLTALGDAINQAKIYYMARGHHLSEVYSFVLQGDPAMQLYRPDLRLEKTTPQPIVVPGETVRFDLTVHNDGLYAVTPTVVDTLPTGLTFTGYEADITTTLTQSGQELTFAINDNLSWGDQFTITIYATFDPEATGTLVNTAHVSAPGWDLNPANRQDSTAVTSVDSLSFIYLPYITR